MFRLLRLTPLLLAILVLAVTLLGGGAAQAQGCEPYCYEPPTVEPCVGLPECYEHPEESDGQSPLWSGYGDGRLNPQLGEYYSVWCEFDLVKVYRVVPETLLIKTIPISQISALGAGESLDVGDFMTVVRNAETTITIYGSNGNNAPQPGEKAFSLSECMDRNGGSPAPAYFTAPETEETPTPVPGAAQPLDCSQYTGQAARDCVYYNQYGQQAPSLYDEIAVLMRFALSTCAGVFAIPGGVGWLRWKRRKR